MKIISRAVWDWNGNLLEEESFDYPDDAPLDLCDRAQSKQVANQGMTQSGISQGQATQAFNAGMSSAADYQNQVKNYRANNPYGIGGQFDQDQRTINADTSNAGTASLKAGMAQNAKNTGQNAASYAPALAEAQRSASRDLATAQSKADQQRIASGAAYDAQGIQMAGLAPDLYSRLYGTGESGTAANLNPAASAAKTPGFMDTLVPALISGGADVGTGFTPHGCWIAEAIYGTDDPRTHVVRAWLNTEFAVRPIGRIVMNAYWKFGQRVAAVVRRSNILKAVFRPLFDRALSEAIASPRFKATAEIPNQGPRGNVPSVALASV